MRLGSVDLVVLHGLCVEKLKQPIKLPCPQDQIRAKEPSYPKINGSLVQLPAVHVTCKSAPPPRWNGSHSLDLAWWVLLCVAFTNMETNQTHPSFFFFGLGWYSNPIL